MMRMFRIVWRVFLEAGIGIIRSGWLNAVIISILMSTLLILGLMLELSVGLKKIANNILSSTNTEFSVFISEKADTKQFLTFLDKHKEVKRVRVVSKEEAWEKLTNILKIDLDSSLNTLPQTLEIKVGSPTDSIPLIKELRAWDTGGLIEHINYAPLEVRKLNILKNSLILIGIFITLLLATATFVINFNTIELVIRARKDELTLLRFMGVSNWFIKGPFIVQGVFYGLVSSSLAGLILTLIDSLPRYSLQKSVNLTQSSLLDLVWPSSQELGLILLILTLTGIVFSSGSCLWATERRLSI